LLVSLFCSALLSSKSPFSAEYKGTIAGGNWESILSLHGVRQAYCSSIFSDLASERAHLRNACAARKTASILLTTMSRKSSSLFQALTLWKREGTRGFGKKNDGRLMSGVSPTTLVSFSCSVRAWSRLYIRQIKMISAQHSSNNGKNWQKLSYQKIFLAW